MTHSFLGITDYHRYHFPVSGIIREVRLIPALDAAGGVMPFISADGLQKLIRRQFPALVNPYPEQFGALFFDIKKKSDNGEISEKPLDLRGLLDAIDLMNSGLEANLALDMLMIAVDSIRLMVLATRYLMICWL